MARLLHPPLRHRALALTVGGLLALIAATPATAQSYPTQEGAPSGSEAPLGGSPMGPGMHRGSGTQASPAMPEGMKSGAGARAGAGGHSMGAAPAPGSTGIDASGDYRQEMQACMQGRTAQDRATCMEEARNARAANRRGALNTPLQSLESNAMARCRDLSPAQMAACHARMMGYGRSSGSVAGGGILRELEIVEMQPGQATVTVAPKGDAPVLVVPAEKR